MKLHCRQVTFLFDNVHFLQSAIPHNLYPTILFIVLLIHTSFSANMICMCLLIILSSRVHTCIRY